MILELKNTRSIEILANKLAVQYHVEVLYRVGHEMVRFGVSDCSVFESLSSFPSDVFLLQGDRVSQTPKLSPRDTSREINVYKESIKKNSSRKCGRSAQPG